MDMGSKYYELVDDAYLDKKLSQSCYEHLKSRIHTDLDELDTNYAELIYFMQNAEYYLTLDRIAKGEEMLASETNEAKKSEYRKLLNELAIKLDNLTPKGESA